MHLVNATAVKQCDGLKHSGDFSDAVVFGNSAAVFADGAGRRDG